MDWFEWKGGECPVAEDTVVETKWSDGSVDVAPARRWRWAHLNEPYIGPDLVAYRVVHT